MPSFSAVQAKNSAFAPTYLPVAVFVGGTSGIGRAMAEALARYTKGNAHIILIGRNKIAAESILASFPKPTAESGWKHEFVECDISLMKNIGAVTGELLRRLPTINYLVVSSGYMSFLGRKETEEGIDHQMAVRYYGRWKFIHDTLPALREAQSTGEASKVMVVLDTMRPGVADYNDLGLKRKYSGLAAIRATTVYTDLALEEFAQRDPEIAFTHVFPGFVKTPLFSSNHWGVRLVSPLVKPMVAMFAISPDVCAEYMLFALLTGEKGFMRRDDKGDDVGMKNYEGSADKRKKLWDHTIEEVSLDRKAAQ
ncbi:hypothetical protein B0H10DRAFT_1772007 [Mycena sp. CBHHK59/15]|nr:hypothetical protein B0H10DRAFT_1772007 [Mycena sp. CBHHK59/15]